MTKELVESIVRVFLNWPDPNVVSWKFDNEALLVKIESDEDGMVEIFRIEFKPDWLGNAASLGTDNFEVSNVG